MSKHTPGPWRAVESDSNYQERGFYHVAADSGNVAYISASNEAGLADARLIAAAPELLAALQGMITVWEGPRSRAAFAFADAVKVARVAIAKAERTS